MLAGLNREVRCSYLGMSISRVPVVHFSGEIPSIFLITFLVLVVLTVIAATI